MGLLLTIDAMVNLANPKILERDVAQSKIKW